MGSDTSARTYSRDDITRDPAAWVAWMREPGTVDYPEVKVTNPGNVVAGASNGGTMLADDATFTVTIDDTGNNVAGGGFSNSGTIKSDDDGTFTIPKVPPGKYTLEAWHERYGTLTSDLTVQAGTPATANFQYVAK